MRFLEELSSRRRFGMKPGLDTIRELCAKLGEPQRQFQAIHIAGTNGKGATAAILDAALGNIARYTSPHLVKLNERFMIGGKPVDDARLEAVAQEVAAVAPADTTFFEALTAVAFKLFAESGVRRAILECGLGGRLDATNVCEPELTIITKIGLDHCDWLGDTVEKIAAEKAGIIKRGVPVILAANDFSVRKVVATRAKELDAPFYYAPDLATEAEVPEDFSLAGTFNRENCVTALAALKVLGLPLKLGKVIWPGRFQQIGNFIVDGAHNPPAAAALVKALEGFRGNLIAGFCGDKDVDGVLAILSPRFARGYAVKTNNPRALTAAAVAEKMTRAGIAAQPCETLKEAMARAGNAPTVICGSLFLAGEALVELGAYPWGAARFDAAETLKV